MRIGTRGSDLALWQARHVQQLLRDRAGLDATLVVLESSGDRDPVSSLADLGGVGAFTREIESALLDGRVDLAVHSHKDLPTIQPAGLVVGAVPARGPVRDVLVIRPDAHDVGAPGLPLRRGAVVGTGSARRRCQLRALRPDLEVRDLRGNVPTRLAKLARTHPGDFAYDAIVLAEAGLARLAIDPAPLLVEPMATELFLPAPAQGALAVQVRAADLAEPDSALPRALSALHDAETAACVAAERAVLAALPGGCNLPLGCLATLRSDGIYLRAVLERPGRGLVHATALAPDPAAAAAAVLSRFQNGRDPSADPQPSKETR
ncbi:MAG TPA: hydroxymethylbilane synthase [Candidatus Krumholzibacteria bacterium]|nr:hydroxymethylbilane synthase [Candidatus Krumholzibacteria bacterium]HPD72017.1 hydroxymethylbilane synthase [Candidatus Krumholzibacteria bacterium]HRY41050.1 hydroxymethylbilane synthase [Candidatus Krumholzibacteria bacterium]